MGIIAKLKQRRPGTEPSQVPNKDNVPNTPPDMEKQDHAPVNIYSLRVLAMLLIVSLGGMIFGYDTGQISGFLEMPDFLARFSDTTDPDTGDPAFSNVRSGLIVGLVSQPRYSSMI